jgi:hypothetical protein
MPFFWENTLSAGQLSVADASVRIEPPDAMRFEPVRDRFGPRLALVFGNHARDGMCSYYVGSRCLHCDIGAGEGAAFDLASNRGRLAWFASYYRAILGSVSHLVIYNSGSVLNPGEMPPEFLGEIAAFARSLPAVRALSLDSREAFIKHESLRPILDVAGEQIAVRPILGVESSDDRIRNEILRKVMPREKIIRVFRDVGQLAADYGTNRIGLDVNIVIGSPGTTRETAVSDAVATARFALQAGADDGLRVDLNLHPYYSGARGQAIFPDHGRCSVETTIAVASAIAQLVQSMRAQTNVFIGWQDEGHDCEQDERRFELKRAMAVFERFNQTNEPRVLLESGLT